MKITIVTSNENKAREVAAFFGDRVEVCHVALECPEFRDNNVGNIAREKARFAYEQLKIPVIVDDTGFFIESLNGFPGPYAAYVLDTIGMTGILRLMEGVDNRGAYFETAIAYADQNCIMIFTGRLEGKIVNPRGTSGFGYDPIFEVDKKTLAEIDLQEKALISHRGLALAAFGKWVDEVLLQ
ncbi:MAG: RdgB/HAM1 family non-canonical purine NTP pyrophosphatase [Deltaproteobacteria bacterium]|nr:RdgB/HAM1 family non-canonical purine NTP pyrophosphatase [Deltaproteobacteria bacterium]